MSNGRSIKAANAHVLLTLRDQVTSGMLRVQRGVNQVGTRLAAVGAGIGGIASAGAGLMGVAISRFAAFGDELQKMSIRTGIGAQALSELKYAAGQSGSDLATVEKGVRKMQQVLVDAGQGSTGAAEALGRLGLSAEQMLAMSPEDQFTVIAQAISEIADPTQRASAAMDIFGKSGTDLLPLMADGARGIEQLRDQARQLGVTMGADDANAAAAFGDALDDVKQAAGAAVIQLGSALAPVLTDLLNRAKYIVATVSAWVAENRALMVTIMQGIALVGAIGAGILAAGIAFKLAAAGITIAMTLVSTVTAVATGAVGALTAAIGFLASPLGIALALVVALGVAIGYATGAFAAASASIRENVAGIGQRFSQVFGAIKDALAGGNLALAARIAWLGIKVEWQRGVDIVSTVWDTFITAMRNAWTFASSWIAEIFLGSMGLISRAVQGAIDLINKLPGVEIDAQVAFDSDGAIKMLREDTQREVNQRLREQEQRAAARDANIADAQAELDAARAEAKRSAEEAAAAAEARKAEIDEKVAAINVARNAGAEAGRVAGNLGTFSTAAAERINAAAVTVQEKILTEMQGQTDTLEQIEGKLDLSFS